MNSKVTENLTVEEVPSTTPKRHDFMVVGIGASAGGISALKQFFAQMPADSGMAFVVILHLSQDHESNLAAILQNETAMTVTQVQETLKVEPNHVYVIPPVKHLQMMDGVVQLVEPEHTRGKRVPIDLLFRTLGEAYHQNGICIVLSGTGSDGTLGLKRVKESGGIAIVQDPSEAEYDGMPRSAIETNLADLVLPIAAMPDKLIVLRDAAKRLQLPDGDDVKPPPEMGADSLHEVLTVLRVRTGHDFSNYKRPTLLRRISRRLQVHELADIPAYLKFLRENPDEIQSLLKDLLISVTNFFRDREAFDVLEHEVVPRLFQGKTMGDQVRVWVAACATGEEAYSIAMLLCEYAEKLSEPPKIQIFASDIDDASIATARDCCYDETIVADVSPERLNKFFVKESNHYRLKKSLRELVLFASHNMLRDPPFSKLDLISCRNLLIYLNRGTQERVLQVFNFALRNNGYLFLGSSESAQGASTLFSTVDKKHRIYKRLAGSAARRPVPSMPVAGKWHVTIPDAPNLNQDVLFSFGELHHKLVERYAPPSVLVNEDYDVVHLSETAGRYLRLGGGEPSRNLLNLAHPGLRLDLRAALIEAKQEGRESESRNIAITLEGENVSVNVVVRPFNESGRNPTVKEGAENTLALTSGLLLVLFEENNRKPTAGEAASDGLTPGLLPDEASAIELVVRRLEEELQRTKNHLRATVEQNETAIEELKASNEELQAINEELRSTTEELETSKEEQQSVNEELTTVNFELKDKIEQVSHAHSDLQNLMQSTDIGTIFLNRELQIRRYTPRIQDIFNIIPSDIGRPFEHLTHKLNYEYLRSDMVKVLRTLNMFEREISSSDGNYYLARSAPYRTIDDNIDGVVLNFLNITDLRKAEETQRWMSAIVASSNDGILSFTLDREIISWNPGAEQIFGYTAKEAIGQKLQMLVAPEHVGGQDEVMAAIRRGESVVNYEAVRLRKNGEAIDVSLTVSPIKNDAGKIMAVTAIVSDITERKKVAEALKNADQRKDEFLAMLAHELRNPLAPIISGFDVMRRADDKEIVQQAQGTIERQLTHIVRLVDDLLDVSRITQGKIKLQMERVALTDVINSALEANRPLLKAAKHELQVTLSSQPIYLEADSTRLVQAIVNLLNNAVKYTEPGGVIRVDVAKEADQAVIRIHDSGIGIPTEMLSSIFDMFTQVERPLNLKPSGLGIGLNLVKKLVEMHGGTVEAFSESHGSEFVVRLPLTANQKPLKKPPQTAEEKMSAAPATQRRILVVDDNADAAEMMEILLTQEGHEVLLAYNGESAVKSAIEHKPEAILLDIGLPDITGYEVAGRIRQELPKVLLIALSGWGRDQDRRQAQEAGFDHHLVKPVNFTEVQKLLGVMPQGKSV